MAAKLAILTTLALFLFSGCIGGEAPPASTQLDPAPETGAPDENAAAPAPTAAPDDGCPRNVANYGLASTTGDLHVFSGRGGNTLVVYRESNGIPNLQTEEECATPDTKIAEVPAFAAAALLASIEADSLRGPALNT